MITSLLLLLLGESTIDMYYMYTVCTIWGCEHESTAYLTYKEVSVKKHEDFGIQEAGLFVGFVRSLS